MTTALTRCLVPFMEGFGGGLFGGLLYYLLGNLFATGGVAFPWTRSLAIAVLCGSLELYRQRRLTLAR
jgi:hypothetical protein